MERKNRGAMQLGNRPRELSPFTTVRRMMEDMDRVFGEYGWGGLAPSGGELDEGSEDLGELTRFTPQVEVFRRGDDLVVRADLPGLEAKDVNVELDEDGLTITGERRAEHEETKEGYFHSERSYGSFERRIPLPSGIERSSSEATFRNGVLEVTLRLSKSARQRIQIRGASNVSTSTGATTSPGAGRAQTIPSSPSEPQPNGPAPQSHG